MADKTNGTLDIDGLADVITTLHGEVLAGHEDIASLFDYCDLDGRHRINLKEFLIAISVEYILGKFPLLDSPIIHTSDLSLSILDIDQSATYECKDYYELILSAYLLFDHDAKGYISKKDVTALMEEQGHKKGASTSVLSEARWNEMDWDRHGKIDFGEFVSSFSTWFDDEEEESS